MFGEMFCENVSVFDFVYVEYVMVDERLVWYYGIFGVYGNNFCWIFFDGKFCCGGLLI